MKMKLTVVFLVTLIVFSSYSCSAQTTIEVGDKYYYSVYDQETSIYDGETYNGIWDYEFYLDIQDIVEDRVFLFWCQGGASPYDMCIYGEENYNPWDLNYPGYFVNISDLDFLYSVWPDYWVSEDVIECTASDRRFYASEFNSNDSFQYGRNYTSVIPDLYYDYGEGSYSFEIIYNEKGVREYFKVIYDFIGPIIEIHEFREEKLTDSVKTIDTNLYTALLSLIIGSALIIYTRRRRCRS